MLGVRTMKRDGMIGLRSYQDIKTPEEIEEQRRRVWERQRKEQERAEYLAEIERDREHFEED
jgi:hypothetical protein